MQKRHYEVEGCRSEEQKKKVNDWIEEKQIAWRRGDCSFASFPILMCCCDILRQDFL